MSRARKAVLCTPLRAEEFALRRARRSMRVVRTGMGPRRAAATAAALPAGTAPVLVAGVGGGLASQVRPGEVVVASAVRGGGRSVEVPSAPLLAGALRRLGLPVHVGPIVSSSRIAHGYARQVPDPDGPLAVDMESVHLATGPDTPFAVVRVIVDSTDHPLRHVGTLGRGVHALQALRACLPALESWAAATGPREVLLAGRSFCAGGVRDLIGVRLVEVGGERAPAYLIDGVSEIDLRWLAGTKRLGITAGAAAPPHLVEQVVHCLTGLGPVNTSESRLIDEDVTFTLPREVS